MKIIWVRFGSKPGTFGGGMFRRIKLSNELAKYKDIEIFLLSHELSYKWQRKLGLQTKPFYLIRTPIAAHQTISLILYSTLFVTIKFFWLKLLKKLPKVDIAVAMSHYLYDILPTLWLKLLTRAKIIIEIHTPLVIPLNPAYYIRRTASNLFKMLFYIINDLILIVILKFFADKVVTATPYEAYILTKHFPTRKIKVIMHGADKDLLRYISTKYPNFHDRNYDIIHFGRLSKEKGTYDLLETLLYISQKNLVDRRLKVILIGKTDRKLERQIQSYLSMLHDKIKIEIFPHISRSKLIEFLQRSRLFVLPSYVDTFSLSILEALFCGTPVIAYITPSLKSVWHDIIEYAKLGNITDLASKIATLLYDKETWRRKSLANREVAYKLIRNRSWTNVAHDVHKLYKETYLGK